MTSVNAEAIEAWNTVLHDKFVRFRHLVTTGLAIHGDRAMHRRPPREGQRVLDLGCGFGDTTRALARLVGPTGDATGVDAAENFVRTAAREVEAAGLDRIRYFAADVQTADLGGPYDHAFSRFGTMFFASAVAALRNVGRAMAPGGTLNMVVWRRREDNQWLHVAERCVREIVPENHESDAPTCGPGPFSMAEPDVVGDQLIAAGWTDVGFDRFDADICIGRTLDEALEFAMALGPAGEVIRLAGAEGERLRPRVEAALRDALGRYQRPDGVFAPSSTWTVYATRP